MPAGDATGRDARHDATRHDATLMWVRASARMKNDDGHYSRIGETVWHLPAGVGAINKVGLWRKKGRKTKQVKR